MTIETDVQSKTTQGAYQTPRVILLGKSRDMIRGYWQTGTFDHGSLYYITGE
jgi:hypothetical protein